MSLQLQAFDALTESGDVVPQLKVRNHQFNVHQRG
jgi:hypothetical protein